MKKFTDEQLWNASTDLLFAGRNFYAASWIHSDTVRASVTETAMKSLNDGAAVLGFKLVREDDEK